MRTLRYADTPEPGLWRPVSPSEVVNWRKAAFERVAGGRRKVVEGPGSIRGKGGIYEYDVARTVQTTPAHHDGDAAQVDVEPIRGIRQHRETVDELTRQTIEWVRSDPALYQERLRIVIRRARAMGALEGMTDEDAMQQLHSLAEKIAQGNAELVYAQSFNNHFWKG